MFQSNQTKRFGDIEVAYSIDPRSDKYVILFHGFGADCWDLFSLKDYAKWKKSYNWYHPNGIRAANGVPGGRAWYPLDITALEKAMRAGVHRDFSNDRPMEADRTLANVTKMLQEMKIDPKKTVVGGFSQGAMLALELVLNTDLPFAGLILLSGAMIDKPNLINKAKKRKGFRFYQSHGVNDIILSHDLAEKLSESLIEAGWDGYFQSFEGGHEIPTPVINDMKDFIESVL